ncbi:MAG: hypothetical protein J0I10_07030 [Verrucomicrobia bacterium]|nr:hypothetical protein [Verrucomicrobiota bacterium]
MKARSLPPQGFSLVEVTLAIGIAGFCLIALFGMLPVGLKSNQAAVQQMLANGILTSVVSDLKTTPVTEPRGAATSSPRFQIPLPAQNSAGASNPLYFTEDGRLTTDQSQSMFRLTVTFLPNAGSRSASLANVKITWPSVASTANASGGVESFVAMDRN